MSIKKEIEVFLKERNCLIDQLDEGKIDKELFIQKNLELIQKLSMKPFSRILIYEEGMYNYQPMNTNSIARKKESIKKLIINAATTIMKRTEH